MNEPVATAWILVAIGIMLAISTISSRASQQVGVPVFLLFLTLGMLAGSEGVGGIEFDNFELSFRIGTIALALILFDGGLNTPVKTLRSAFGPAILLATLGVVGTALIVATAAYAFGFGIAMALLLGAIVSSTDAAAVFSTLRASGVRLKQRVATTLELESGLNDPVAIILTIAFTYSILEAERVSAWIIADILVQLIVGGAIGVGIGFAGKFLLGRMTLLAGGLFPVLTLAIALLAFGLPTLVNGSGFLSVYIAGLIIGNARFPYRSGVLRFHDAFAWLSQVSMFVLLGLLVTPSQLLDVALVGIFLAATLVFVARPAVVALCLAPLGFSLREIVYVGWIGLRGAVPIILATFPVLAQIEGGRELFNVVFFIVVLTAIVPGGTVGWITRRLDLASDEPPPPRAMIDITSMVPMSGEVMSFHIDTNSAACGTPISDIPLSESVSILLILRGEELIAPKDATILQAEDHIYVFCKESNIGLLSLLFGAREQS